MVEIKNLQQSKISDEDYFALPHISNSDLTYFSENGYANFWNYKFGQKPKLETTSLTLGSLVHCMILEPDEVDKRFVSIKGDLPSSPQMESFCRKVIEGMSLDEAYLGSYKTTAKYLEKKPEELYAKLSGYIEYLSDPVKKQIVTTEDWDKAYKIVESYEKNEEKLLNACKKHFNIRENAFYDRAKEINEVTCEAEIDGVMCKAKIDKYIIRDSDVILIDLKTTKNSSPKQFRKSIENYKYVRQLAFYYFFFETEPIDNYIVALQTEYPYPVQIYSIHQDLIDKAQNILRDELAKLKPYLNNPESLLTAGDDVIRIYESYI